MILKLHNKNIIVKDNEYPEDIYGSNISYEYELGTNHLRPVLYVNSDAYIGNNIKVPFASYDNPIHLHVELYDGNNTCVKTYTGTYTIYKTFTLGTEAHVNIYKELLQLRARIKELEEKGDVI